MASIISMFSFKLNKEEENQQYQTLWGALLCTSISPLVLNRNTLKARWSLTCPSGLTRWQSRFDDNPNGRSFSSTKIQFSSKAASCKWRASNAFAAMLDRFLLCCNVCLTTLMKVWRIWFKFIFDQCQWYVKYSNDTFPDLCKFGCEFWSI